MCVIHKIDNSQTRSKDQSVLLWCSGLMRTFPAAQSQPHSRPCAEGRSHWLWNLNALPSHLQVTWFWRCLESVGPVSFLSLHLLVEPSRAKRGGLMSFLSVRVRGLSSLVKGLTENLYLHTHTHTQTHIHVCVRMLLDLVAAGGSLPQSPPSTVFKAPW